MIDQAMAKFEQRSCEREEWGGGNFKSRYFLAAATTNHRLNFIFKYQYMYSTRTRGPFLESPGNLPGPVSVFGDKYFLTEVNFFSFEY